MKFFVVFLLLFTGLQWAVLATPDLNEWKESCRKNITEIEQEPIIRDRYQKHQSVENVQRLKQKLDTLLNQIGRVGFICIANNKPDCNFHKSNSLFLYSLTEAIGHCNDICEANLNIGQSKQNANIVQSENAITKLVQQLKTGFNIGQRENKEQNAANFNLLIKLVHQLRTDFNTLVTNIELFRLEECDPSEWTKERVKKQCRNLTQIQEDIKKNKGFSNEAAFASAKSKLEKIVATNGQNWKVSDNLDEEINQILLYMLKLAKIDIYENELSAKIAFLKNDLINGKGIMSLSKIFRLKYEQIYALFDLKQNEKFTQTILRKLSQKTSEKAFELDSQKISMEQELNKLIVKAKECITKSLTEFNEIKSLENGANAKAFASRKSNFAKSVKELRETFRSEFLSIIGNAENMPNITSKHIEAMFNQNSSDQTEGFNLIFSIEDMEESIKEIQNAFKISFEETGSSSSKGNN